MGGGFDRVADTYDATRRLPSALMEASVAALAGVLGPGPVLEAGVGTGRYALPLRGRGVRVVGVDVAPKMLALAREKGCDDLLRADAARLPFRDRAFPASTAIHVLHLLANWRDVLRELARVTRDRFVTLHETIRTEPLPDGGADLAHGDAVTYPMPRYQALAAARGHGFVHPGVRPPEMVERAPPILREPVGSYRIVAAGEELLAPIAAKTHSSQWHVPDDVHAEIMRALAAEVSGRRFERTWTVEVVAWRPGDLLRM